MRVSKPLLFILTIMLMSMTATPVEMYGITNDYSPRFTTAESKEITGVPYVWQEINGFCVASALSMVLQSMGLDLTLYDTLAASGSGFSMVSISVDEAMTFYPGVMVRQIPWIEFFTELYGLKFQFYLDSSTDYGGNALMTVGQTWDIEVNDYADSALLTPLGVMRDSIDSGYPLAIAVDTYYLPPVDWDIVRDYVGPMQPGEISHAIVVVGYNDTSQTVRIYDPGVGLLEPYVGYPDDGRWNYTMSYTEFDSAWQSAGFVTFRLSNGTSPVTDFEERLASHITQRLLGNRTSYFEGYENFFYLSTGANAFRGMGLDMTFNVIREYCFNYREVDKPNAIRSLGQNLEAMMTMQYMAFRSSLDSLPNLLPSYDLEDFLDEASKALPHMDALSHNASIQSGVSVLPRDTILYNTFFGMASSFESSHDLDGAINEFSEELGEIAGHFFAIADAWKTAGKELLEELGTQSGRIGTLTTAVGGGFVIIVIGGVILVWRRKNPITQNDSPI